MKTYQATQSKDASRTRLAHFHFTNSSHSSCSKAQGHFQMMNPTLIWGMAASLLRTSLPRPRCLVQIRPRVLIEGTPCKYSPGWITRIHTSKSWPKDPEAIKKAVLEVSSFSGKMPKRDQRKVLAQLNPDEKRAARKRIKLAARKERKELKEAQLLWLKTAGETDLNPLTKSAEKDLKQTKVKGKSSTSNRPNMDLPKSSSTRTPDTFAELDSLPFNATRAPFHPDRLSRGNNDRTIPPAKMLDIRWEDPKGNSDANRPEKPHLPAEPTSSASTTSKRSASGQGQGQRPQNNAPHLNFKLKGLSSNRHMSHEENTSDTAAKG